MSASTLFSNCFYAVPRQIPAYRLGLAIETSLSMETYFKVLTNSVLVSLVLISTLLSASASPKFPISTVFTQGIVKSQKKATALGDLSFRPYLGSLLGVSKPVDFSFVIHAEGYDSPEDHEIHKTILLNVLSIFETYGGKVTIQPDDYFIDQEIALGTTFLSDVQARGHGVSWNAVADSNSSSLRVLKKYFKEYRTKLRSLGITADHLSGVCSHLDWVDAVQTAGFTAVSGVTAFCLGSMADSIWPSEYSSFLGCAAPEDCHVSVPATTEEAIYPWYAKSGSDWFTRSSSGLLIIPHSVSFDCAYESIGLASATSCDYTPDDKTEIINQLELALLGTSSTYRMKVTQRRQFSLIWSLGTMIREEALRDFLQTIKMDYADTGKITWKTVPEIMLEY